MCYFFPRWRQSLCLGAWLVVKELPKAIAISNGGRAQTTVDRSFRAMLGVKLFNVCRAYIFSLCRDCSFNQSIYCIQLPSWFLNVVFNSSLALVSLPMTLLWSVRICQPAPLSKKQHCHIIRLSTSTIFRRCIHK